MGVEAYLEAAASFGFTQPTTALAVNVFIPGKQAKRISILSYSLTTGTALSGAVFMVPVSGISQVGTAMTAAATAFTWNTAKSTDKPSNIATGDYVVLVQDDSTYLFTQLTGTATTSTFAVSAGTQTTIASANAVYYLASSGNAGHYKVVAGTTLTTYTDASDIGRFFGSVLGGPMIAVLSTSGSGTTLAQTGAWNYISIAYINV